MRIPSRRTLLPVAAATCAVGQLAAQSESRPNILYIMSDDHAYQAISAYGDPVGQLAPTPNIDRIARQGMRFDQAFVENSLSAPSRACLITGLYSHQNGQRQLAEGIDTTKTYVSELLQRAGYQTAMVGKWHLDGTPKGFDYYHVLNDQGTYYNPVFRGQDTGGKYLREEGYATNLITDHAIEFLNQRDPSKPFCLMVHHKAPHRNWIPALRHLGMYDRVNFPLPPTFWDDYATRGSATRTQKMHIGNHMELLNDLKVDTFKNRTYRLSRFVGGLNQNQTEVLYDYFKARSDSFNAAPPQGRDLAVWKYQHYLRDYLSVIHAVDESVGQLLDYLEKNHLLENTLVVYTSDQGFYLGEHGWFDKRFMYEESLRTPLVMMYPGHIRPGSVCRQMVQNIDFAPTFLRLAEAPQPAEMTGRPLTPLFSGEPVKDWRKSIYYHYYDYPTWHLTRKHDGVRTDRYKLIHFYGRGGTRAQQENKFQRMPGTREYNSFQWMVKDGYIVDAPDIDYMELYDLRNDPLELHNVYGQKGYEKITRQLQRELDRYRRELQIDEY